GGAGPPERSARGWYGGVSVRRVRTDSLPGGAAGTGAGGGTAVDGNGPEADSGSPRAVRHHRAGTPAERARGATPVDGRAWRPAGDRGRLCCGCCTGG